MLYTRWRIMGTGPPAFTEVDNPASFEENIFLRVSFLRFNFKSHITSPEMYLKIMSYIKNCMLGTMLYCKHLI